MSNLKIDVRRKRILAILNRDGIVRVAELSKELGATSVTIRNDLAALENDGYLERTSGGAILTSKNIYKLEFLSRSQKHITQKKSIASAAAALIRDGETLMINSGTTAYYTAIELKQHKNLNIVTNSLAVAMELGGHPSFRVILLGGEINAQYAFTYGQDALEQLRHYRADKTILSIDGIGEETGLTTYHAEEAIIDRLMMERSNGVFVVADYSKLGRESFSYVSDLSRVSCWITDSSADKGLAAKISRQGVEIIYTPSP